MAEENWLWVEDVTPAQLRRIEQLGCMNDRRMQYLVSQDKPAMLRLAEEYAKRKMPLMAAEVRQEADSLAERMGE